MKEEIGLNLYEDNGGGLHLLRLSDCLCVSGLEYFYERSRQSAPLTDQDETNYWLGVSAEEPDINAGNVRAEIVPDGAASERFERDRQTPNGITLIARYRDGAWSLNPRDEDVESGGHPGSAGMFALGSEFILRYRGFTPATIDPDALEEARENIPGFTCADDEEGFERRNYLAQGDYEFVSLSDGWLLTTGQGEPNTCCARDFDAWINDLFGS